MDGIYGQGKWRFVPRFVLHQSERDRLIDDAKRGGQNAATSEDETIFTETHDWLGEVLATMVMWIARL